MGVCNCSMFCCALLYVHSSIAIILMGKRELVALLLSSWCLVMVEWLFLTVPRGCLRFLIVVFPDHTHLLFFYKFSWEYNYVDSDGLMRCSGRLDNSDLAEGAKRPLLLLKGKRLTCLVVETVHRDSMHSGAS